MSILGLPRVVAQARPSGGVPPRGLLRRALAVWVSIATVAALMVVPAQTVFAAVPADPDNILIFPDRDFISVAGYENHVGETALLELTRPGVGVIGSATAVVAAGGVAFEINHPGGVCWGNGTALKVTPDIQPGDIAAINFAGVAAGDVRTLDAFVTASAVQNGTTVTVGGHIGPGVIQANTEQRIISADLVGTEVGKRDVRAVPGPLTTQGNYSSSLEFPTPGTFLATYVFQTATTAAIVANAGAERLLSWEFVDPAGNRQGITIAEFGLVGGPGVGGCPNGPLQSGPVGPTNVLAATQTNGDIVLTWTPAVAVAGTPAITGYRVHAVGQTATVSGTPPVTTQIEIGRRITGQAATGTRITGLIAPPTETYDVEVVSVSSAGETFPAIHAVPVADVIPPVVTASPVAGTYAVPQNVTLSSNEPGQIWFTNDGIDPIDASGVLAPTATLYTAPIPVAATTTLKFTAFDPSGNFMLPPGIAAYVITNLPTPAAPTFGPATVGQGSISLTWTDAPITPAITEYTVTVYDAATGGLVVGTPHVIAAPASSTTITGLTAGTPYWVTIKAANTNGYGPESARLGPLTPQGAIVANAGPDQSVVRGSLVTLNGSASIGATTFSWVQTAPATPVVALTGATTASPTFTFPATLAGPLTFQLTVTGPGGSASDSVTISPLNTDPLTLALAQYRTNSNQWRLNGTATVLGAPAGPGNNVTILLNKTGSQVTLGTVPVDSAGVWTLTFNPAAAQRPVAGNTITIFSSRGGLLENRPITIRQ